MSLSDLASLGSFVSGVAVLISLVYLALQVRQAERNQRALINEAVITRVSGMLLGFAQQPFVATLAKQQSGATEFSAEEIVQMNWAMRMRLLSLQDSILQHKNGLIDAITLENSIRAVRNTMLQPVERALWLRNRSTYASEFATFVDKMISEAPPAKSVAPRCFPRSFSVSDMPIRAGREYCAPCSSVSCLQSALC